MQRVSTLHSRLFQDGCDFEVELLGRCLARYSGSMHRPAQSKEEKEKEFGQVLALVRKNQPARKTEFCAALEREFERRVGAKAVVLTAVESILDFFHGADAVVEFQGEVVTLDVTTDPEKTSAKADVVVHPDDVADLARLTTRIARAFVSKLERR